MPVIDKLWVIFLAAALSANASFAAKIAPDTAAHVQSVGYTKETSTDAVGPDLYALKYYAARGDMEKYQQEALRLRLSYPGFPIPTDPMELSGKPDQQLWDLFSQGRIEDLQAAIKERKSKNPYWHPEGALVEKLEQLAHRKTILSAFKAHDFASVIAHANDNAALMRPQDGELLLAVAQSLVHEKHMNAAVELFEAMLNTATSGRQPTELIERAAEHLPLADAANLYKSVIAKTPANADLDSLRVAFARGLVIRSNAFGFPLPFNFTKELKLFEEQASRTKQTADLELLAWSAYSNGAYDHSLSIFSKLPDDHDHLKAIEGRILSLKQTGQLDEARKLAGQWKDANDDLSKLYVTLFTDPLLSDKAGQMSADFLHDYAARTKQYNSGAGAEALGWYAFRLKQYRTSDAWFNKAIDWDLTETAAYGKTLLASYLEERQSFNALKSQYQERYPTVAALSYRDRRKSAATPLKRRSSAFDKLAQAHKAGQFERCVALADKVIARRQANSQVHQTRGWCLMQLDRPTEAQYAFEASIAGSNATGRSHSNQISRYGAGLAALRRGDTQEAERLSRSPDLTRAQSEEIAQGVLSQKALSAFRQKRYGDSLAFLEQRARIVREPRNLSELRAWSLYHLGRHEAAYRLFVSLNTVVSSRSVRDGIRAIKEKSRASIMLQ